MFLFIGPNSYFIFIYECIDYYVVFISESKYDDEIILIGSFKNSDPRRIDEYTIHKLKDSHSFDRYPGYNRIHKGLNKFRTKVQFETPYLYSTANWWVDDCSKNVSKIYPSQPIYQNYGRSVKLRNKIKKVDQQDNEKYNFTYQILSHTQMTTPELKFLIPGIFYLKSHKVYYH